MRDRLFLIILLAVAVPSFAQAPNQNPATVICDGVSDVGPAVNRMIGDRALSGGTLLFPGVATPCKLKEPLNFTHLKKWMRLLVQGTLDLSNGSTLVLGPIGPGAVELEGEAGAIPLQFAWKPSAAIIPPDYRGTLGCSTTGGGASAACTPRLSAGSPAQMVAGAAVSVGYGINLYSSTPVFAAGTATIKVSNTNNVTTSTP